MQFSIDLRFLFLPFLNFIFFLVWRAYPFIIHAFDQYLLLKLTYLLVAVLVLILFLFTSITINLRLVFTPRPIAVRVTCAASPITVRFGFFSRPLSMSLLASVTLAPPHFWVACFVIIISSPLHGMLWDALKYVFDWFVIGLRSCATFVFTCHAQHQDPELPDEFV